MGDLSLWPGNPRRGDVGAISESLKRFGQLKPIVVQASTMRIVAGNHVYRAAAALGWTDISAYIVNITDKDAKAFVAADNRMSDLGDFDDVELSRLLGDILRNDSLVGTGYDQDDLDALLAKVGTPDKQGFGDPDETKPVPAEPWVKDGQLFQLGPHRILCGDGGAPGDLRTVLGGATPGVLIMAPGAKEFDVKPVRTEYPTIAEQFWFGAEKYSRALTPDETKGSWLVWDKRTENTDGAYGSAFELIWSYEGHKYEVLRHTFLGAADGEKTGGPDSTDRPTSLYMDLFERYTPFEAVVLDPFSLGATALLAAEKSGRIYCGIKGNPAHVQALLEKWTSFTGEEPKQVGED